MRAQASKLDIPVTKVRSLIDRIKKEGVFPGFESMISLIYPEPDNFFNYMPDKTLFILFEPAELEKVADQTLEQASKSFIAARNEKRLCVEPESLYLTWSKAKDLFRHNKTLTFKKLPVSKGSRPSGNWICSSAFDLRNRLVSSASISW